jgi:hypothetical protein
MAITNKASTLPKRAVHAQIAETHIPGALYDRLLEKYGCHRDSA